MTDLTRRNFLRGASIAPAAALPLVKAAKADEIDWNEVIGPQRSKADVDAIAAAFDAYTNASGRGLE